MSVGRTIKRILLVLGGLVIIVMGAAVTVFLKPSLVVNRVTLDKAAEFARRRGVDLKWEKADVDATSEGIWRKSLTVALDGFCFRLRAADGCFREVRAHVAIDLSGFRLKVTHLGPAVAAGGVVRADLTKSKEQEAKPAARSEFDLRKIEVPRWLRSAELDPITVELDRFLVVTEKGPFGGEGKLEARRKGQGAVWQATAKLSQVPRDFAIDGARASLSVVSRDSLWQGPYELQLDGGAGIRATGGELSVAGNMATQGSHALPEFELKATHEAAGKIVHLRTSGNVKNDILRADVDARLVNFIAAVPRIAAERCLLTADFRGLSDNAIDWGLGCDVDLAWNEQLVPAEARGFLPGDIKMHLAASAASGARTENGSFPIKARAEANIVNAQNRFVSFTGRTKVDARFDAMRLTETLAGHVNVDHEARVHRFEWVVDRLSRGPWAIPAPLNVLNGNVLAQVTGDIDLAADRWELPFKVQTDLASRGQNLAATVEGLGGMADPFGARKPYVRARVMLNDVKLALPTFNLRGGVPQFLPDRRFLAKTEEAPPEEDVKPAFDYRVDIVTTKHPVRITSNLVETPVPLKLDLAMASGEKPRGQVLIDRFKLNLFRRPARVERFEVKFRGREDAPEIDGRVIFDYTDYIITAVVAGTVKEPSVKLFSDPPATESNLYSLLLFGRDMESLDREGKQSVSEAQSAFASGAISLASMYFLASTPIQSVSFDPATQAFSAKVSLGHDTAVTIGGGENTRQYGIRKRLGRNWSIELSRNLQGTEEESTRGFLQWSKRY